VMTTDMAISVQLDGDGSAGVPSFAAIG